MGIVFVAFMSILLGAFTVAIKTPRKVRKQNKVRHVTEVVEYDVHQWGRCDWYYDKNGCLKMRKCEQKTKSLPRIWKLKDGVCAK